MGLTSIKLSKLINKVKSNSDNAINEFWTNIEKIGSPLVEKIEGDNENVMVTFLYRGKENIKNILIYGGVPGFRYSENIMEKLGDTDIWFKTYKVRSDVKFKYNFSLNYEFDGDYKKIKQNSIIDPLNPNKVVFVKDDEDPEGEEITNSLVKLPKVKEDVWIKPRKNVLKGNLKLNRFHSEVLKQTRRIWVYTPYDYSKDNKPYNLLVLNDGFEYINYLLTPTVLDNLIYLKKIPSTVCVLVESTESRYEDLTCNELFSKFISEELMSWVRENYNVSKDPKESIIGGVSLGGLAASYIALKNSNIFGNVLSESGSYWYESEWLTKQFEEKEKLPIKFYMNVGLLEDRPYDDEPIMMDAVNNMRDALVSKGYDVNYENFQSGHDYLSWGETLANGLITLLGDGN